MFWQFRKTEVGFEGDQSKKKHLSAWKELKWKKCSVMLNIKINIDAKHSTYNTDFLLRRNSTAYIQRFVSLVFRDMSHQGISKIWLPYTIQILKHRAKKLEGMKCFQSFFGVHWHIKTKRIHLQTPKDLTFSRTNESELSHYAFGSSTWPLKWIPKGINRALYAQNTAVTPISEWHTWINEKL